MGPAIVVRRESYRWDHTVHASRQRKTLPPGVQVAEESNVRAGMPGIGGDLDHHLRARAQTQVVKQRRIPFAPTPTS